MMDFKRTICILFLIFAVGHLSYASNTVTITEENWDMGQITNILAQGFKLNASNKEGNRALVAAAKYGRVDIVKALREGGADLNFRDHYEDYATALIFAVKHNQREVIDFLILWGKALKKQNRLNSILGRGLRVNAQNERGWTALMFAVRDGRTEIVDILLSEGADPNLYGNYSYKQWSPLMSAAWNGHLAIVQKLVTAGAKLNNRTKDGRTALALAAQKGHTGVVQFLRSKGAR